MGGIGLAGSDAFFPAIVVYDGAMAMASEHASGVSPVDYPVNGFRINEVAYATVNNGVHRAGFAGTQQQYHEAVTGIFATLDDLEERLAGAFRETTNFDHIKRHYYMTHSHINPSRIVPEGPKLDWSARRTGPERHKP